MRIIFVSLLLLSIGAASPPPQTAARAKSTAAAAAVATPRLPDAALEKAIRARFQRSKIAVEGFTVRVEGGVATIQGKTSVIQRKGTATRLAKLAGARAVENRIVVDEAALAKASANLEQGRRRAQIKRGEVRTERTAGKKP